MSSSILGGEIFALCAWGENIVFPGEKVCLYIEWPQCRYHVQKEQKNFMCSSLHENIGIWVSSL